ncbi:MAG: TonB-dependent receptor, partial [Sphingobacteriales bacterium]
FSPPGSPLGSGTTFATRGSAADNNNQSHNLRAELEISPNKKNFIRISPSFTYNSASNKRADSLYQSGLLHQDQVGLNTTSNTRPQYGISAFYQYIFDKRGRNFSIQSDYNSNDQAAETAQDLRILYYLDSTQTLLKDSLVNRIIARKNLQNTYRGSMTFVEPLSSNTQLELNSQVNYNGYDNRATTQNAINAGSPQVIDSLSNIYDYSFTQARIALNYRYGIRGDSKVKFSLGLTAIPAVLSGTKVSLGTTIRRTSFNMIPIARFEYAFSRQHRVSVNYSGNAVEPTFDQIQPVRDVSNPNNPIVGNPDLKATFAHSVNASYNNYIAASKLNYSLNLNSSFTDNAVIRNNVLIQDAYSSLRRETKFLNADGVYRVSGFYSVSKQLANRKYNLSFNGSVSFSHGLSMSNNLINELDTWTFSERFGPRLNPTEWFEINPNVSFNYSKSTNTLPGFNNSRTNTTALNVDGRVFLWKTNIFGYSLSKNYVSGINANITNNPFVINMYAEKELFNRRGKVTLQAFDILNQNNFINRNVTDDSIVDTKSNTLSRYFMLRLSMRLQKWTGPKGKRDVMRRNDGSFIMN